MAIGVPSSSESRASTPIVTPLAVQHRLAAGKDDFCDNWSREVLDRRPLILVTAVLDGQVRTWLMEPVGEGVLSADVSQFAGADGATREWGHATGERKSKLLTTIAADVSWLVKENPRSYGRFLHER